MKIYKYKLELVDNPIINMPGEYKILCAKVQHNELFIWAEVNEDEHLIDVRFRIYGTGTQLDDCHDEYSFISTVLDNRGLVWHVYRK